MPPNGSDLGSSSEHSYPYLAASEVLIPSNDFSGGSAPKEQNRLPRNL